jgi:hypothetical protein
MFDIMNEDFASGLQVLAFRSRFDMVPEFVANRIFSYRPDAYIVAEQS